MKARVEVVELTVPKAVRYPNLFKVPKKQWVKWPSTGKRVFNEVYATMRDNPWAFQSPKVAAAAPSRKEWKTTCWNAAWIAADALL